MKTLLIFIPILFCLQDTIKVDTLKAIDSGYHIHESQLSEVRLFFEEVTVEQRMDNISTKLDSLLKKLEIEAKKDTIK